MANDQNDKPQNNIPDFLHSSEVPEMDEKEALARLEKAESAKKDRIDSVKKQHQEDDKKPDVPKDKKFVADPFGGQ